MTRVKLCGLMSPEDIEMANLLRPDYTGFVFAANSRRCITETQARHFRSLLSPDIPAVGVALDERVHLRVRGATESGGQPEGHPRRQPAPLHPLHKR